MSLPPGATLVSGQVPIPLPPGASLVSQGDLSDSQAPESPSNWDKVRKLGADFWNSMPVIGPAHELSGALQDWAAKKMPNQGTAAPSASPMKSAAETFGLGVVRDTAGLVHGATSPAGVATAAAGVAAPEIAGPALIAHGIYSGVKGWGDVSNPDVLQKELNAGAEIAGGAAMTGATIKAGGGPVTQQIKANAAAKTPVQSSEDFQKAIPPSKSTPYEDIDYQKARPYLEAEHANTKIDSVEGARDAADSAIGKIEDRVSDAISKYPTVKFNTWNTLSDVKSALSSNARGQSFVKAGLRELDDFDLDDFHSMSEMDDIRQQLNAENKAVLKKNNYDIATAQKADPGFAARAAASESIRNHIYDNLETSKIPGTEGIRNLRLDEGSLIKVRNAAQNQLYNADKGVPGTAPAGTIRKTLGRYVPPAAKAVLPEAAFNPQPLTRSELVERSFNQ
jgi:hypothetical protein